MVVRKRSGVLAAFALVAAWVAVLAAGCSTTGTSGFLDKVPDAAADGTTASVCSAPQTSCGGACVDTSSDPTNCGACATRCQDGEVCSKGACALVCGGGTTKCGATCNDTKT